MALSPYAEAGETSNPVKRLRWATQRVTGKKASQKRRSIFQRAAQRKTDAEKKRESGNTDPSIQNPEDDDDADDDSQPGRSIYFNLPLPDSARDPEGRPIAQYKRNKIRTAKYTPLSFVPKNLWFQFHNIANIYFLILIILTVRLEL